MENGNLKGIYCITNETNGKMYIGSTVNSFKARIDNHRTRLRANGHKNRYLQRAWNKYGEEQFSFKVIEVIEEDEFVLDREQFWIDSFEFDTLYNINPFASGGLQFSDDVIKRRVATNKKRYKSVINTFNKWKKGDIKDCDLTQSEFNQFTVWVNPWHKGKKYDCTEHLKVPKRNKGDRSKDIETKRNKSPAVEVYTTDGEFLKDFRSSKDLEDWSITPNNDLPVGGRFSKPRMGKSIKYLNSGNINKACSTGKPYKNLIFKFKTKAPNDSDVI